MNSIFSYESTPMQILMYIGDLIILNFLFLLCCMPIFTIGAAQAGLYSAVKVLQDKEDDSSPAKAFFKGFKSGFGTVTLAWGIMTVILLLIGYLGIAAIMQGSMKWLVAISVSICGIFQCLIPLFHSRFNCTAMQLIRNGWFLLFAHPLRSIFVFAVVWLPAIVFLLCDMSFFMSLTPIWMTLYYSTAFLFGYTFMKKPFNVLIQNFNETHNEDGSLKTPEQIAEEAARKAAEAEEEDSLALPE